MPTREGVLQDIFIAVATDKAIGLPLPIHPSSVAAFFTRFKCQRGGACCTREGYAELRDDEVHRLAALRGQKAKDFLKEIGITVTGMDGKAAKAMRLPCVFWSATEGCTVYEQRPRSCQNFPLQVTNGRLGVNSRCPGGVLAAGKLWEDKLGNKESRDEQAGHKP